jgi:hypothetical protein
MYIKPIVTIIFMLFSIHLLTKSKKNIWLIQCNDSCKDAIKTLNCSRAATCRWIINDNLI